MVDLDPKTLRWVAEQLDDTARSHHSMDARTQTMGLVHEARGDECERQATRFLRKADRIEVERVKARQESGMDDETVDWLNAPMGPKGTEHADS